MNSDRLQEIFEESLNDSGSVNLSGRGFQARMRLGIKISRDNESGDIMLYDHTSGGNYYVEMREKDQVVMEKEGWLRGVFVITLDKYKSKLERIKQGISAELNGNNSKKRLNFYKEARKQILNKYYKVTQKLNN